MRESDVDKANIDLSKLGATEETGMGTTLVLQDRF